MPFKNRVTVRPSWLPEDNAAISSAASASGSGSGSGTSTAHANGTNGINGNNGTAVPASPPTTDLLMHSHLAPILSKIDISDILAPASTSLILIPPAAQLPITGTKRGPRGKDLGNAKGVGAAGSGSGSGSGSGAGAGAGAGGAAGGGVGGIGGAEDVGPAPGTGTALAIASGQQAPRAGAGGNGNSNGRNAGASTHWVMGKSLAELKKMEAATQFEQEADWARIQGVGGRGRRARGD